jgi:hypothetical protein
MRPSRCTSASCERPPAPVNALLNLAVLLRGPRRLRPGRAVPAAGAGDQPQPSPRPPVHEGCPASREMSIDDEGDRDLLKRNAAAGYAGDGLRAVRPRPHLPQEDEHPHARRPAADHRGRAAELQELRREQPHRDQAMLASKGLRLGQGYEDSHRSARRQRARTSSRAAATSGCSTSPSATCTSPSGPARRCSSSTSRRWATWCQPHRGRAHGRQELRRHLLLE